MSFNPHVSIDCVVFGFDGENLKVLLNERVIAEQNQNYNDKKLPGSLILDNEDLDNAASRVLSELTGLKNIYMSQFHSFGKPDRINNPRDILWLEKTMNLKIGRIVTIGYVALIKIDRKIQQQSDVTTAKWYGIDEVSKMNLAFDHNEIIHSGLEYIRGKLDNDMQLLFELLPGKFSISQLRTLHDTIYNKQSDVRNFQKKMSQIQYIIALDEKQQGVKHRAARLYKFDKMLYKKMKN